MKLFQHNQVAYENALAMMQSTGKAAIIHPTGTGKSFIAFQLALEHPQKRICWISPSEYIFRTQLENLSMANAGEVPSNILFFTYSKLSLLSEDEKNTIYPDYIVLDEFHRCGAQIWGAGVIALLEKYPDSYVLGLSATNIRYLDNQRDMADELFDGNIASQMNLGEAIVRGILNPPKYVLSAVSYQKDFEKYHQRIRTIKSKAARDESEKYLQALRRALEKADGLAEIFRKHMDNPSGKYVVFCASKEHMDSMIELAPDWFHFIDTSPHIYSVYSDDPETSRAFAEFKADRSGHLKLLYCIDMLNEGVHVDDVDGVILLRPTISPIIYKQQIGRALSASKKKNPVIFDIVMNIANLYSIGAIEEEMQTVIAYYRFLGRDSEIINDHFRIIDEVRNCIELFEKLNDSLTASWELMYNYAKHYAQENGDLEVHKQYMTNEGYSLGSWIQTQRRVRAGKSPGILTENQIKLLDDIGMRWENIRDIAWEKYYAAAKQYYAEHGNLRVTISDNNIGGVKLGHWISQLRSFRKSGIKSAWLTTERVAALDALGMIWDVPDYLWERNFAAALAYHREHGNIDVPVDYVDSNGIRLGAWLSTMRQAKKNENSNYRLTTDQIDRLNTLGMNWINRNELTWEKGYEAACRYKQEYGNLNIPVAYTNLDGFKLGRWIRRQKEGSITDSRKKRLSDLGMVFEKKDPWLVKFQLLKDYYDQHGHIRMPAHYVVNGIWLQKWLTEQRARLNGTSKSGKTLTKDQIIMLESVGIRRIQEQ